MTERLLVGIIGPFVIPSIMVLGAVGGKPGRIVAVILGLGCGHLIARIYLAALGKLM